MPVTVFIADDQEMVRQGLAALLNSQPDISVVGDAPDGRVAVREVKRLRPDVVLMDVRMPNQNGLDAAREILGSGIATRVLILTTFDLDDYVYAALALGASGFLLKDASAEELARGVRVVAAGDALLAPTVTRRLIADAVARHVHHPVQSPAGLNTLTAREREVLELVARGLSNQEIAEALFVATQTVKAHVSKVLAKLGLRDRAQAVVLAYETGLVTRAPLRSPKPV